MLYDPNLPQTSLKKQLIDQSAHALAAFVVIAVVVFFHSVLAAFVAGALIGVVREVSDGGKIVNVGNAIDVFFWGVGGAAAYALLA